MKSYIESAMHYYPSLYSRPSQVVAHMFATLGNGVDLNMQGWLEGNCQCEEPYKFPEPIPLEHIYPWSKTERYQPFRDLAGCRDVGFKEAAQYFIDCVKLTPDDVKHIKDWKDNLHIVEDVLMNTPTITDEYENSDNLAKFLEKISDSEITNGSRGGLCNSVRKVWYFDVQWSDCPEYVEDEVRQLWTDRELGNDCYIAKVDLDEELFSEYPRIYYWLKHKGVGEGEQVIIHWWW